MMSVTTKCEKKTGERLGPDRQRECPGRLSLETPQAARGSSDLSHRIRRPSVGSPGRFWRGWSRRRSRAREKRCSIGRAAKSHRTTPWRRSLQRPTRRPTYCRATIVSCSRAARFRQRVPSYFIPNAANLHDTENGCAEQHEQADCWESHVAEKLIELPSPELSLKAAAGIWPEAMTFNGRNAAALSLHGRQAGEGVIDTT